MLSFHRMKKVKHRFAVLYFFGDPYRIRTDVKGVRGLCLNHLTNGPYRKSPAVGSVISMWYTFRDSNPGHPD